MAQNFDLHYANTVINDSIRKIFLDTMEIIKQKQVATYYPDYAHNSTMGLFNQYIYQASPDFGAVKSNQLLEQTVDNVVRIDIDNLTPKQLPHQNLTKDLPEVLSQIGSRKLNITNRSSFLKRKISLIPSIPSINDKQQKKALSAKKDPLQNFKSVIIPSQEDPQIVILRQKSQFKYQQRQKQKKQQVQREQKQKETIQNFKIQFQNKDFTFDYKGDTVKANDNLNQKLVYYTMKVGMRTLNRKFRNDPKDNPSKDINAKGKTKPKQTDKSNQLLNSSFQIPVFPHNDQKSFHLQSDPSKLKIKQYKRLYAHKFNRYDKNTISIDMTTISQNRPIEQDLFSSKRHFHDTLSANKSHSSSISKEPSRRIALPRLQGKYKVLDRYQQF